MFLGVSYVTFLALAIKSSRDFVCHVKCENLPLMLFRWPCRRGMTNTNKTFFNELLQTNLLEIIVVCKLF